MTNPAKKQKNATTIRFDDDYTLQVIDKAAELLHQTRTGFLLSVAREKAEAVIRECALARREIEGFLEKGKFIPEPSAEPRRGEGSSLPDSPVDLPGKTKAFLTIEQDAAIKKNNNKKAWGEFLEAIKNAENEELIGSPQRLKFKTPEEIDLL
jgi:uncharacterized protein (DUF1778 family)